MISRNTFIILLLAVLTSLGASFAYVVWAKDTSEAITTVIIGFVVNLMSALFAVAFGVSRVERRILEAAHARETAAALGPVATFWHVPNPDKPWTILFGGRKPSDPADPQMRLSYETVYAFSQLSTTLHRLRGPDVKVELRNVSDVTDWDELSKSNVVMLGGVISIPRLKKIYDVLPLKVRQQVTSDGHVHIVTAGAAGEGESRLTSQADASKSVVVEDHALVMRLINQSTGSSIFSFSGGWGPGTLAGVLAMTSKQTFKEIGFNRGMALNYTVVSVKDLDKGKVHRGHPNLETRDWYSVPLDKACLINVTRELVVDDK